MPHEIEPLGDWVEVAPWKSRSLLLVATDSMAQAGTITEKQAVLADPHGLVIAVWPGRWSISARYFELGDAEKVLSVLG